MFKRIRGKDWMKADNDACPLCDNPTWQVIVHPNYRWLRTTLVNHEGLCKTCCLSVSQYFKVSACPNCFSKTYFMTGTGGRVHPWRLGEEVYPPVEECFRCGYNSSTSLLIYGMKQKGTEASTGIDAVDYKSPMRFLHRIWNISIVEPAPCLVIEGHSGVGDWLWCMCCGRCYQAGEYRLEGKRQMCPYSECHGDTVLDSMWWYGARIRQNSYPEVPERGVQYLCDDLCSRYHNTIRQHRRP